MLKQSTLPACIFLTWLMVDMIYLEWFVPPFDALIPWIMPWKELQGIFDKRDLTERLFYMQELMNASTMVSDIALISMVSCFAIFGVSLTLLYQQKQRRSKENRLLTLKNQEIARRTEFIQYISATIGHEFKNNLGRIKRRIDLLPEIPKNAKLRIDYNMEKLFADIEIFKKISDKQEKGLRDFTQVLLEDMVAEIAGQNNDLADITIDKEPHPVLFASQALMKTVFENLIDNSIKYKRPDQKKASITVSFTMDADGRRKYLTVLFRDKGKGMTQEEADHCFYKNKESEDGWGEGLYFVKYAIGLHAGKVKIGKEYTKPGEGTEVIINLPFVEEDLDV